MFNVRLAGGHLYGKQLFTWLSLVVSLMASFVLSFFPQLADLEAKSALSLSITNLRIPHSDFKSNIHQYVMNKCKSVWEEQTGNKLHELKPDFNSKCSFLGYSRQIQTKITRCRIGHTRLTHSYLLTNEQPPFCISCNEPFTVKHFLITCTEFNYTRNRYFTAKTVKNFLLIHLLTKSSIFLKKLTFLTSCNYVLLYFNGHTNRFTDSINLDFL